MLGESNAINISQFERVKSTINLEKAVLNGTNPT